LADNLVERISFMRKNFTEADIKTKYILPAIINAGWDLQTQVREEVSFTHGRIIVRGKMAARGTSKRADYILYYKPNIPLAIIEAKDDNHQLGDGMQQALEYAEILDIPFVFTSNGTGFRFHDKSGTSEQIERDIPLDCLPSPQELWKRYKKYRNIEAPAAEAVVAQDYYSDGSGKSPRYYQLNAINRTMEAIAKGRNRILLVMATGTGKTYTAFQIIWRLWKSKTKKRILFLADRNILVDQTRQNDFKPFGQAMTKISKRQIDKSYEIYLSLYQAVTGNEEEQNIYKQFSPDFFDLIIIDECHRSSAAEDSAWRAILEYFSGATQIGLTATPKETADVSNIDYFGEPVYTYSLKQGIEDGFLAPYKVIRIDIDRDVIGFRPEKGQADKYGNLIEDRIYNQKDFNRTLVIEERDWLVAQKITAYLKATNRFDKTIVFCEDIDHAERMRHTLANLNSDLVLQNHRYVMKITGDDQQGKAELDNFIDPESVHPVIATTSKLLTTGVDAKTCKLIVLDQRIQSMTEFKQIIGRGTRIDEEHNKLYFTIMDFKKATELFADPDFDGDPVQIYHPTGDDDIVPPDDESNVDPSEGTPLKPDISFDPTAEPGQKRVKYYINNVEVHVVSERVQYYDKDGKLVTESLKDYTKKMVQKQFRTLDEFLRKWSESAKKEAIIKELEGQGLLLSALREEVKNGDQYSTFDLICHIVYGQPPLTRKERAENVRKRNYFTKYGEKARKVLDALLDKYSDEDVSSIESAKVLSLKPINEMGTPVEIINDFFGGKDKYEAALKELEDEIFKKVNGA
jgi:type I restriction enzyme R subunit